MNAPAGADDDIQRIYGPLKMKGHRCMRHGIEKLLKNMMLVTLISFNFLYSQVIWSDPEYPTQNDSIIIYVDPTQALDGRKINIGETIYAHTGVTTSEGRWQNVVAGWSENITKAQLSYQGSNVYKLVIGKIDEYYGSSEPVSELCFVFRSADGARQTEDLFLPVYEAGLSVVILEPVLPASGNIFSGPQDSISIKAMVLKQNSVLSSFVLMHGSDTLAHTLKDTLKYTLYSSSMPAGPSSLLFEAKAFGNLESRQSLNLVIHPPVNTDPRPAGVEDGIHYSDQSVILSLFAPGKDFIYVLGDFNNWSYAPEYLMNKYEASPDSSLFWLELQGLTPDTEYAFQYEVDGEIRVADPYSELILDPWNDRYIPSAVYPGLKPYPAEKTWEAVSVLNRKSSSFQWSDSAYVRPARENLIIYELLIRDFIADHDLKTLVDSLDYLQRLGINTIELMPVNEFEGNDSWGYNPSFYFAPDKYYGRSEDLKYFINEAHRRGMAVVIDMVLNHSYNQSPLVRLYNNGGYSGPSSDNPWYNVTAPHTDFGWGSDFNHESVHTEYFVDRVNRYWVEEYHVDGYRYDFTRGFTNKSGYSGAYDASRVAIIKRMANAVWEKYPETYIILEHLTDDNNEMKELSQSNMLIWGGAGTNYNYNEATMGWHDGGKSDFSWSFYKSRGWLKPHLVSYMESHDEERLMYKNLKWGNGSGSYSIKDPGTALDRQKLAAAFFLTLPGPKMIWQFGELGYDYSINYDFQTNSVPDDDYARTWPKPVRWDYTEDPDRYEIYETYRSLIHLRNEIPAFTSAASAVNLDVDAAVKSIRISGTGAAEIVGNFDVVPRTVNLSFVHPGTWYDYFSGEELNVEAAVNITLAPGDFRIYTDRRVENPAEGILTGFEEEDQELAEAFVLGRAYPNPFNPVINLPFHLGSRTAITVNIYDISGRLVDSILNAELEAGDHSVTWSGRQRSGIQLPSGVYIVKYSTGDSVVRTQKILMLK